MCVQVDGESDKHRAAELLALGRTAVKVGDFGMSVALAGEQSHLSDTRRGTHFYTSPETIVHHQLHRASDVWYEDSI
jgi:serine/threonine protein kinase